MLAKTYLTYPFISLCLIVLIAIIPSCKYDTLVDEDMIPPDTSDICNPEILYFERDVLPVFRSSCGFQFCHDNIEEAGGVILDNYDNIIKHIKPFDPDGSIVYQQIVESNLTEVMPPFPRGPLSERNIEVIRKWIQQGALDLTCVETDTLCGTDNISFSQEIFPIIDTYCEGCHSGSNPFGGLFLRDYTDIKIVADNGKLFSAITHDPGFSPMPKGLPKLDSCKIDKIAAWISDGAPDN